MKIIFKKRERKNDYKIFIIFLLFLILIFDINVMKIKLLAKNGSLWNIRIIPKKKDNSSIISLEYYENSNITLIKLGAKKFIDKCLIQQNNTDEYRKFNTPIISSIIPIYNSEKTIASSICSIRCQNYKNYELILIDDFSTDNSYNIIKGIKEYDNRIIIIKNKKNMGSLYSRCIGVLMSKGEYIIALDNDDMFISGDIFDYYLNIAEQYNFDIVGFRSFSIGTYQFDNIDNMRDLYLYQNYPKNIIVHQPQLSTWLITENGHFYMHDVTIWAKCIKTKIYKEAIIKLGKKRYSIFLSWAEDTVVNFIMFTIAKTFIFIHKYGIIHLMNSYTASYRMPKYIILFGEIFLLDIIYEFTNNNSDKNYAAEAALRLKRFCHINQFYSNDTNLIYFKSILNKIKNCTYISNINKIKIENEFKTFFI